jgi:hypothetical protein
MSLNRLRVIVLRYLPQVQSTLKFMRSTAMEYERLSAIRFAKQIVCVICGIILQQLAKISS